MFVPVAMPLDLTVWYARKKKRRPFSRPAVDVQIVNNVFHFAALG